MIHKRRGELVCTCDECGAQEHGGTLEFKEFWAELKENGWRAKKEDEQWSHTCPECSA